MNSKFDQIFQRNAKQIFPALDWKKFKAQGMVESNLQLFAISGPGAIGIMQIMPETGREMGFSPKDLENPEKNIAAGILYMKKMFHYWKHINDKCERWKFALASYNAGIGNIKAAFNRSRRSDYEYDIWSCVSPFLSKITGRHAKETINYVARIIKKYKQLKSYEIQQRR